MFNVMAQTTQKLGVTVSSLASKMSLIIPVIAGVLFQNENLSILKIISIIAALTSIYLTVIKKENKKGPILLAFILFVGSGILDASLSLIRFHLLNNIEEYNLFTSCIFLIAFVIGLIIILINKKSIQRKNIIAGIVLGIPNYFSIYCLLKALELQNSSIVFPVLNISIVVLTTIIGWKIYNERLSKTNFIGLTLALTSIIILVYS
jgi:drug/metabolite transporter (DMT)-like permease